MSSHLGQAFRDHRGLYLVMGLVALVILAETIYLGVPLSDFSEIAIMLVLVFVKFFIFMSFMGAVAFYRAGSWAQFKKMAASYFESPAFSYGLAGAGILISAAILFIIQKCYANAFNPIGFWDPYFAAWDKALHFGHYPQEYIIMVVNRFPLLARVMDIAYGVWFLAMFITGGYCLYADTNKERRMHFMWAYVVTFIIVGNIAATALMSVGPVFFGDFYPNLPNPYQFLLTHLDAINAKETLGFVAERHWLVEWTRNDQYIDFNAISAMPSMHNATMLFCALYWRQINRKAYLLTVTLAVAVFFATIYCGFHYAIDAYVGYAMVLPVWFIVGRYTKRLYSTPETMVLNRQQV